MLVIYGSIHKNIDKHNALLRERSQMLLATKKKFVSLKTVDLFSRDNPSNESEVPDSFERLFLSPLYDRWPVALSLLCFPNSVSIAVPHLSGQPCCRCYISLWCIILSPELVQCCSPLCFCVLFLWLYNPTFLALDEETGRIVLNFKGADVGCIIDYALVATPESCVAPVKQDV